MTALAPRLRPARVTVTLTDGRSATHARDSHRGDFHAPFGEDEIRAKFRELAGTVLTPDGAAAVEAAIDRCEEWQSVAELPALLRRGARVVQANKFRPLGGAPEGHISKDARCRSRSNSDVTRFSTRLTGERTMRQLGAPARTLDLGGGFREQGQ